MSSSPLGAALGLVIAHYTILSSNRDDEGHPKCGAEGRTEPSEETMDRYKIMACGPKHFKIQQRGTGRIVAICDNSNDAQEIVFAVNTIETALVECKEAKEQRDQLLVACQRLLDFVDDTGEDSEEYEEYADTIDQIREAVKEVGIEE